MFPRTVLFGLCSTPVWGCLVPLNNNIPCEIPGNPGLTIKLSRTGLLTCMDMCVNDGRGCTVMKWNQKLRTCYIFRGFTVSRRRGKCMGFLRTCLVDYDFIEMQRLSYRPARKVIFNYTTNTSEECRILCTFWSTCLGVTWKSQGGSCMLHSKHLIFMISGPLEGYEYFMKNTQNKARCLSLKAHAMSSAGLPVKSKSLLACLRYLTAHDFIKAVDWFDTGRHCETFTTNTPIHYKDPHMSYSHVMKLDNCVSNINVCSRLHAGAVMLGGYHIGTMLRKDCFSICKLVRTCVAATFLRYWRNKGSCQFHDILRKLEFNRESSTLQIVPCEDVPPIQPAPVSVYSEKLSNTLKKTQGYRQSNTSMLQQCALNCTDSWLVSLYNLMNDRKLIL